MRKLAKLTILYLIIVFCAFLIFPESVFADEGAVRPISGEMEFIPAQGNHLGDLILLRVKVSYDRNLIDFDHRQAPQALNSVLPKLFKIKEVSHNSQRKGNYITEIWEFRIQFLGGPPPLKLEIPSFQVQYKEKALNYFFNLEIPGASVSFDALTSEDSLPDPVIKNLTFGPDRNTKALIFFSSAALFTLLGVGLGIILFLRWRKGKRKTADSEPVDEFMAKYNSLRDSLERGEEDGLIILHKLYLLLMSFYRERRGVAFRINWQNDLSEEERNAIEGFQKLYGESMVPKVHAHQLLQEAKKILEK